MTTQYQLKNIYVYYHISNKRYENSVSKHIQYFNSPFDSHSHELKHSHNAVFVFVYIDILGDVSKHVASFCHVATLH